MVSFSTRWINHIFHEETSPVSEAPNSTLSTAQAAVATPPATPAPTTSPLAPTAISVASGVVQGVQAAHPNAPVSEVASKAATILGSIAQMAPEIFAVSRTSAQTQGTVAIGLGVLEAILQAFI